MKKLYNKKQSFFIIVLITFILITASILHFSSSENYWVCSNSSWVKHGHPKSSLPTSICPPPNSKQFTSTQVIENFYNWYFLIEGNPISSGYYKNNDFLTSNFKNKVDSTYRANKQAVFNPFICNHTENPISFSSQEIYNKNNKSLVMVYQSYISSQDRLEVSLIKNQEFWYIDNINCAKSFDSVQGFDLTPKKIIKSDQIAIFYPNLKMSSKTNDCSEVFIVDRKSKSVTPQLKEILNQLFTGPTDSEKDQGYTSWFSSKTKNILKDVTIKDDTVYLNFSDIRQILPNVSSSCGYTQFNSSIQQTISASLGINKVVYSINGSTKTFYDWVQQTSPQM